MIPCRRVDDVTEQPVPRVLDTDDPSHHRAGLQPHLAPHLGQVRAVGKRLVQLVRGPQVMTVNRC
jgi:hypothetical protein